MGEFSVSWSENYWVAVKVDASVWLKAVEMELKEAVKMELKRVK